MSQCKDNKGHQTEDKLDFMGIVEKSRRDYLTIFDSVPAVIWYRDRDGKILRANQSAADSVGLGVRELVGKNYYELVSDDAERSRKQDIEVITTGRPQHGVLREFKMPDGSTRWFTEDRIPLRDKDGKVVGVMSFALDVTDKKQAEERLVRAKKEIEIRNEQLKAAAEQSNKLAEEALRSNLAKSEILASSSHDLRTPMNAIIGFAELLKDTQLDSEQGDYVETIYKSANGLLSLINDILDFTKLEVGKLNIQIVACNLSDFIDELRSMMEPGVLQKGLTFDVQIGPRLPETFFTDPVRLRQCLVNLIGNASKFTKEGGIKLFVNPEDRKARTCIRFDVEDTGIGISKDKQHQIFQSYSQAEDATEKKYGGTGLGLTITEKLVGLLGGHVSVMSELDKGSVFSIVLPLIASESPDIFDPTTESQLSGSEKSRNICQGRILVAEANLPSQLSMNLLFRRMGLSVDAVSNADQLYEKAQTPEFDIVILDLMMDDDGGVSIIRKLREINRDIPVIAIAHSDLELMERALAAGCSKYLTKPVSRRQLYNAISELLQLSIFEKKLKDIDAVELSLEEDIVRQAGQSQESPEIPNGSFTPEEMEKLLPELINELSKTFDCFSVEKSDGIMDILDRLYAFCENEGHRRELKELQELFGSKQSTAEQCNELLLRLEEICRDIHESCRKES